MDIKRILAAVVFGLLLQACEAPLVLDAVEAEKAATTHRSDRFQALTKNDNVVVGVGAFGAVLVSEDVGKNWHRQQLAGQPMLIDVVSCPSGSLIALALEGDVWVSTDDGKNWASRSLQSEETPQALTCAPDGRVWVVASFSTFLSSSDEGETWEMSSLGEDMILGYIRFFDDTVGVVTGEFGTMAKTTDGGQTWELQTPMPNEFYPMATKFVTPDQGWVAGLSGKIFSTSDGGQTWVDEPTGKQVPFYGLASDANFVYAVGEVGTVIYRPLEALAETSWQPLEGNQHFRFYLRGILPLDGTVLLAGGAGSLRSVLLDGKAGQLTSIKVAEEIKQ